MLMGMSASLAAFTIIETSASEVGLTAMFWSKQCCCSNIFIRGQSASLQYFHFIRLEFDKETIFTYNCWFICARCIHHQSSAFIILKILNLTQNHFIYGDGEVMSDPVWSSSILNMQSINPPSRPWQEPLQLDLEEHWALQQGLARLHIVPPQVWGQINSGDQFVSCFVPSSSPANTL